MSATEVPPQYPAGEFQPKAELDLGEREDVILEIASAPERLRAAIAGLDERLGTKYRNWTIRQIVHHLADSHINGYVRHKLALTEERATIKPYDESRWSLLDDAVDGPIAPSLKLLEGLHNRWTRLLRSLDVEQFRRAYFHPEAGRAVTLDESIQNYAWHGRHHTAQIEWVRRRGSW